MTFYVLLATDVDSSKRDFYIGRSDDYDRRITEHTAERTGKTGVSLSVMPPAKPRGRRKIVEKVTVTIRKA